MVTVTKGDIADFLGFPRDHRVARRLLEGMADVPAPDPDHDSTDTPTLVAFAAFLRCAGPPSKRSRIVARPTLLGGRLDP